MESESLSPMNVFHPLVLFLLLFSSAERLLSPDVQKDCIWNALEIQPFCLFYFLSVSLKSANKVGMISKRLLHRIQMMVCKIRRNLEVLLCIKLSFIRMYRFFNSVDFFMFLFSYREKNYMEAIRIPLENLFSIPTDFIFLGPVVSDKMWFFFFFYFPSHG